jgi:glycosyltransferase involved in cell wall biosynthesis
MSSRQEGFPMVLLEAMGVGLPAVSVDCRTGPREIITEGVDGYVVPERDTQALASAMSELMSDAAKRRAFGIAALEAAARYDAGALAERWEAVLDELAGQTRGRRGTIAGPAVQLLGKMLLARGRKLATPGARRT